jgi:N-acetylmuramic acid 6-phosphate etherase
MLKDRSKLTTEKRNVKSGDIDKRSTLEIVDIINAEDAKVAPAVRKERKAIAKAADMIAESLAAGGRLIYVGAGTSGRLGVLDASECPPTFGTPPAMVQGIIAGGRRALVRAIEGAEDRAEEGGLRLKRKRLKPRDVVVGTATCGLTPFVIGAVRYARKAGAKTVFITCSPEARGAVKADIVINPVVGPEVVTGSTRMKAGTATKLVLNTLTTTAMIKLGKVYGNLMVDLRAGSSKLRDRAERIVMQVTGLSRGKVRTLLREAEGGTKAAIVMHARGVGCDEAEKMLRNAGGSLRKVIEGE